MNKLYVIRAVCPCGYTYTAAQSAHKRNAEQLAAAYGAENVEDWIATRRCVLQRQIEYTVVEEEIR